MAKARKKDLIPEFAAELTNADAPEFSTEVNKNLEGTMWKDWAKPSSAIEAVCRSILAALFVASAPIAGGAAAKVAVTTYHYDSLRTGWNSSEKTLTASNFPRKFGIVATVQLDDQVDAQPLIVPNLNIGGRSHDVVYVATESNSIYAIDASSGQIIQTNKGPLQTNLGPPVPSPLACNNNGPNVGITGTPVVDLNRKLLFVIAYVNLPPSSPTPGINYQLHALNLSDLANNVPPVTITASHTLADGETSYAFSAAYQRQRPGLLELNGVVNGVYAGFGSFCDYASGLSRGWILGWSASSLAPLPANQLNDTRPTDTDPPFFLSSVWMSGFGIASDGTSLYFSTGNSDCEGNPCPPSSWTGTTHIQESVAQLSSGLALGGVFTPYDTLALYPDALALDQADMDLGSGGVMLFSTGNTTYPYLAVAAGKDGRVFLLDPANLGTPTSTPPPLNTQQPLTSTPPPLNTQQIDGCWCGPSFFVGSDGVKRVVTSHGSTLRTWRVQMSTLPPTLAPEATATIISGQDPGFFTSVSSNGAAGGSAIIWAVGRPPGSGANPNAVSLYAFAATPSSGSTTLRQLFSAPAGSWPNATGNANIVPVVANGKVFVASAYLDRSGNTRGQLNIFGTGGSGAPISSAPIANANAVETPANVRMISGTLIAVSGDTLTLKTRGGATATIDASGASRNQKVTGPLKLGTPYTAQGTTFDASGALVATAIARAKHSSGLWPSDR